MATIVYQKQLIDGQYQSVGQFLPLNQSIDEGAIQQALKLDKELGDGVASINKRFARLRDKTPTPLTATEKWTWLGQELCRLIKNLKNMDPIDIDRNTIWPAINQYLDEDLKKPNNLAANGGLRDHSRRCYYFVLYEFNKLLPNWAAWLALSSRGNHFMHSQAFRNALKATFAKDDTLTASDYKKDICGLFAERWPSNTTERVSLDFLDEKRIQADMKQMYDNWKGFRDGKTPKRATIQK